MADRPHPLLYAFAAAHVLLGAYGLWLAAAARFAEAWSLAAIGAPLLLANGVGLALRREPFDRTVSRVLVGILRIGGGFMLIVGVMGMREDLDGVWTIMGVSLAVGLWGVAFGWVLERSHDAFAPR
jgi:hypothetical protein